MDDNSAEVIRFDPAVAPAEPGIPQVLWTAPGSLDTDLLHQAWQRRGSAADLAAVSGPWGAVLWDPQGARYLIATDPVGVMPLYWTRTSDGLLAASAWLARLVDRADVDDSLDHEGIVMDEGRGCNSPELADRTRFRAVRQVPQGRYLLAAPDCTGTLHRYWDPRDLPGPDGSLSLADCADLLRERIDAAVRRHTAAPGAYGAHISGGLDCTAVACRAQQVLGERGQALVAGYSWAPSEEHVPRFPGDERQLLDDVSAAVGVKIRTVYPDESGDWFWGRDPNRYAQSTHMREMWTLPQARADGIGIMLSGWGGDELSSFNGRATFPYLVRRGKLATVWKESRSRNGVTAADTTPAALRGMASALLAAAPTPVRDAAEWVRRPRQTWEQRKISARVDAELRQVYPALADARRHWGAGFSTITDPWEYRLRLLDNGHIQHRTGWWYQTGRLFDVHYRYPLLDVGVVSAALQLPWWAFRSHGWGRVAYRRAVSGWVPDSVAWNTAKYEPALFWPPSTNPVSRSAPPPRGRTPDPEYGETMRLVNLTYRRTGAGSISPDSRVSARPEAAPPE